MSINTLFQKANKFFIDNNHLEGFRTFLDIWFKYPKNTSLYDEINRISKKYKKPIIQTFSNIEIASLFTMNKEGKINIVINKLLELYKKKPEDILLISLIGTFYGLNKDFNRAIFFQKLAIEKAPFEVSFYLNLSVSLKKINKTTDALSILYFAKILSLKDQSIDFELAKLNVDLKNYLEADLIYKNLIKEKKHNKDIFYHYCANLIKLKKEIKL